MKKLLAIIAILAMTMAFAMCKDVDSDTEPGTGNHGGAPYSHGGAGGGYSTGSDTDGTYIQDFIMKEDIEMQAQGASILPYSPEDASTTGSDDIIGQED